MTGFFFFNDTATTEIYTLSLHDALPILFCPRLKHLPYLTVQMLSGRPRRRIVRLRPDQLVPELKAAVHFAEQARSEEHTSELQSPCNLVCRLLLEKNRSLTTCAW